MRGPLPVAARPTAEQARPSAPSCTRPGLPPLRPCPGGRFAWSPVNTTPSSTSARPPPLEAAYRERIPVVEVDGIARLHLPRLPGRAAPAPPGPAQRATVPARRPRAASAHYAPLSQAPQEESVAERLGWCGGSAQPVPPGPRAGEEDGQGPDLLAGDLGVHEHQRDPDPPRPLGLRPLRQARRRLLGRLAAVRDPQDPPHPGTAQHRARRRRAGSVRRSRPHRSSPSTASRSPRRSTTIRTRRARRRGRERQLDGRPRGDRARPQHRRRRPCGAPPTRRRTPPTGSSTQGQDHLQLLDRAPDTPADVQVHTSNPAVELLYALYFHLT